MAAPKIKIQAKDSNDVVVRHVPAYPIPIEVAKVEGQPSSRGQIVKLAEHGFMMKIDVGPVFKVGDEWHARFETPASHVKMSLAVKVMKTYDAYEIRGHDKVKIYTIEMHFKSLTQEQKEGINNYLVQSGQKKRALI
jgi:hypothetical protein